MKDFFFIDLDIQCITNLIDLNEFWIRHHQSRELKQLSQMFVSLWNATAYKILKL